MNRQDRLAEIEKDLSRYSIHKKVMLLLVIALGISTAFELYEGSYWAVCCDILCAILSAINVSLTEKEDQALISEKHVLLEEHNRILDI